MGFDCYWTNSGKDFYLSYNFSVFRDIWYIQDARGHTGKTIKRQLIKAFDILKKKGFEPVIKDGQNGWTQVENVFYFHLKTLLKQCEHNLNNRFYTDVSAKPKKYVDSEGWSDGEDDLEEEKEMIVEKIDGIIGINGKFPYRHPIRGTIQVDNYELAMECYNLAKKCEDDRASAWLKIAEKFKQSV